LINQKVIHIKSNNVAYFSVNLNVIPDTPNILYILDLYAEDYFLNNNKMLNNFGIKWDINEIIVDKYSNKIRKKIIDYIKKNNIIKPNSMHRYSHVLDDFEHINELIIDLN
jgi:hypothetical protein